jgi:hypothetical protein
LSLFHAVLPRVSLGRAKSSPELCRSVFQNIVLIIAIPADAVKVRDGLGKVLTFDSLA